MTFYILLYALFIFLTGGKGANPNIASYKKLKTNFYKYLPNQSIYALRPDSWWEDSTDVKSQLMYKLSFSKDTIYTVPWDIEASFSISDGELNEIKYYTSSYDTMECRKYYERILEYMVEESKEKLVKLPDDIVNYLFRDSLRYYGLNKYYSLTTNMIVDKNEQDLLRIIIYHRWLDRDYANIQLHKYPRRLLPEFINNKIESLAKSAKRK